ncbi:type II toxin-antitoxin system VapC family toxin [Neorhizobium sp. JUb45]|uniref:type II toxin-antitoxin system VapC family toxin n=1 Tax=unclassified Neorhizobium TaxID=2629175 RepID=UPI00104BDF46|nr:type II toxin-antitoxin system VapC family toxin [Neorhizobium sp. JUb45]TCR01852.1 putative nucleic acid-binding protein [Neorhizobium sp. JUb45]
MGGVGRIYLDTNLFITAFETQSGVVGKVALLLGGPVHKPQRFVTSELTLAELLVLPYRNADAALIDLYDKLLSNSPWLDVRQVYRDIMPGAARLRAANLGLKLPDAIHLATAVDAGCTYFLTYDLGIAKVKLPSDSTLTILRPDEATLTSLLESLAE